MADKIKKIISPEGIKAARNELAYFFRLIAFESGVGGPEWEYKLRKYLEQNESSLPRNPKDRSYARGNLNTQLMDTKMTWNVFKQALLFLGATKVKLKIELTWPKGAVTHHEMNIRMRNADKELSQAEIDVETPPGAIRPASGDNRALTAQPQFDDEDDDSPPFEVEPTE